MTRIRLTAEEAAQLSSRLADGQEAILLEGPDGKTLAAAVPAGAFLDSPAYPAGYFDCPPKITLEEAEKRFGVRPRRYFKGRPIYSQEEMEHPAFQWPHPPEDAWVREVQAARSRPDS
ncbi:MAG: hypothetical protein M5U26_07180 [Planctomycetota bacterium]|nr:hypothetical protein [Planctomycetota bacterium]